MDAAALTAIVGLIGVLAGTIISPRVNHKLGATHNKQDLLFKRKLEYFEKIVETIEKNKRMYHQAIGKIENSENKKEVGKVIEELKQNRKNFMIMASPLYFDIRNLSEKIVRFVRVEKEIFNRISALEDKEKKDFPILTETLKELLEILNRRGNEIIFEMRKELRK